VRRGAVLVPIVALVAGLLASCTSDDGGYRVTAYFARGVSLYAGSDVRVLGLPAGEIESVSVEGTKVKVVMTVRDDIPVPRDVQATLVPLSLIGERYVQLFPAWTEGQPRLAPGAVIPLERTSVPVEPDEALAALKEFLDSLDPSATGRLITNLADDLEGNGQALNDALGGIAELTTNLADKDEELVRVLENFDEFTATLVTREQQLGRVLDSFATTAAVLAEERRNVERLVKALGQLSVDGLDLVSEHRLRLQRDVEVLTRTLLSVQANMASVRQLLDAAPIMVAGEDLDGQGEGLNAAYDPVHHRIDLRNATSPVLSDLFRAIGLPSLSVCVPVGVACPPDSSPLPTLPIGPSAAAAPPNPVAAAVGLLGSPTDRSTTRAAELAGGLDLYDPEPASASEPAPSGPSSWLRSAGRAIAEVLS
jgi:phospholipid/cholesterol/gamma-HCH transport system substrate-binding protein